MKNQEQAFLEAILEHPDDDTPRLIFADWLEEHGDADRAEFIRLQCALAGKDLPSDRRAEWDRRQQQLLEQHEKEWVRPIRRLIRGWKFHRGFIDEVIVSNDQFLDAAERIVRAAPIQNLKIQYDRHAVANPIAALAETEHLCRMRSLDLSGNRLESRHLSALVVSEYLMRLTDLNLSHNRIGDSGIRALANAPLLSRLERVNLSGNDVGPAGMRALGRSILRLSRSAEGLRLRRVNLQQNNLSAAGQRVIADSPILRRLVHA